MKRKRTNRIVTDREMREIKKQYQSDIEKGLYVLKDKVKDNYMYMIHCLLYNVYLQPKERLCKKYKGDNHNAYGILQDGRKIKVNHDRTGSRNYYSVYIDGEFKGRIKLQSDAVNYIQKVLNLRRWDYVSGSERVESRCYNEDAGTK